MSHGGRLSQTKTCLLVLWELSRSPGTVADIARRTGISLRMAYRYIHAIGEFFDLEKSAGKPAKYKLKTLFLRRAIHAQKNNQEKSGPAIHNPGG